MNQCDKANVRPYTMLFFVLSLHETGICQQICSWILPNINRQNYVR